ncbi:MAG: hypothetical protein RLZZ528_896 [Pseudomonadota bacterium]|jgi:hypothetical protein
MASPKSAVTDPRTDPPAAPAARALDVLRTMYAYAGRDDMAIGTASDPNDRDLAWRQRGTGI